MAVVLVTLRELLLRLNQLPTGWRCQVEAPSVSCRTGCDVMACFLLLCSLAVVRLPYSQMPQGADQMLGSLFQRRSSEFLEKD